MTTQDEWRKIEEQRALGRAGMGTGTADNAREVAALQEQHRLRERTEAWRRHDQVMAGMPVGPASNAPTGEKDPTGVKRPGGGAPNAGSVIVLMGLLAGLAWIVSGSALVGAGTLGALASLALLIRPWLGNIPGLPVMILAWLLGQLLLASMIGLLGYMVGGLEGLLWACAGLAGLVAMKGLAILIEDAWAAFWRSRLGILVRNSLQLAVWTAVLAGMAAILWNVFL